MNSIEFKKKALEKAKELQAQVLKDLRSRIEEMKGSEMMLNDDQFDRDQQSQDEAANETINHLADELNFAEQKMIHLNKIQITEHRMDNASIGAIVTTDKGMFFPSVSTETFKISGEEIKGISKEAPFFKAMQGKIEGETFVFKGQSYKILEIF